MIVNAPMCGESWYIIHSSYKLDMQLPEECVLGWHG